MLTNMCSEARPTSATQSSNNPLKWWPCRGLSPYMHHTLPYFHHVANKGLIQSVVTASRVNLILQAILLHAKLCDTYWAYWLSQILNESEVDCTRAIINVHPDSKVHWVNMGPIWGRQDQGGPHVGHTNLVIGGYIKHLKVYICAKFISSILRFTYLRNFIV